MTNLRSLREPTAKNLLREPLVFGLPVVVLIGLALFALVGLTLFGDTASGSGGLIVITAVAAFYAVARAVQFYARTGWVEPILFVFERKELFKKLNEQSTAAHPTIGEELEVHAQDTLEDTDLIHLKHQLQEQAAKLKVHERWIAVTVKGDLGFLSEIFRPKSSKGSLAPESVELFKHLRSYRHAYSLTNLPTITTPTWLSENLAQNECGYTVVSSLIGLSSQHAKTRIETARRRNAHVTRISNVDADVAFEESTRVLEGLARGDDAVVCGEVVVFSNEPLELDGRYFSKETNLDLICMSAAGLRHRTYRGMMLRAVTSSDLVLNIGDAYEEDSVAILKTPRNLPLYFDPQDSRLEALHWLVTAASGAGKSFFVGLVLLRLVKAESPISILFVDHNRSFRRVTKGAGRGEYLEPATFEDLAHSIERVIESLGTVGTLAGIELSDLATGEKREAIQLLLTRVEAWLRARDTIHPVYLVLDESWNFMRDEPLLVQRAFREFRKLNGAAIAITQSLSDFLMDESGRAIFQNAPIRVMLRQAEDLQPYRGVLGLNQVELRKLRALRQKRGEYSECLIKTPYLSRVGRLYPTPEEYELLRTDNIREEMVRENQRRNHEEAHC